MEYESLDKALLELSCALCPNSCMEIKQEIIELGAVTSPWVISMFATRQPQEKPNQHGTWPIQKPKVARSATWWGELWCPDLGRVESPKSMMYLAFPAEVAVQGKPHKVFLTFSIDFSIGGNVLILCPKKEHTTPINFHGTCVQLYQGQTWP